MLDTWFSSALWPFATLGWPDDTEDLRAFYPGDLNTTARDIIRLWENRMIFSGLELMGDVPFRDVVIHSLVHAPHRRRMSKSLGTGMNPLALIEELRCGRDPLRADEDGLVAGRALLGRRDRGGAEAREEALERARSILPLSPRATRPEERPTSLEERWILARLSQSPNDRSRAFAAFDFSHLVDELYHLTFDDFCDWYAEAIKPRLYDGDADARATALAALERLLKLLHPAMPHVTEEIWSNLPARKSRLIVAAWPEAGDEAEAGALDGVQDAAATFRRSGVLVPLEGDEKRIFEVVVKPERQKANGNVEAERERLHGEIARAEGMLANDRLRRERAARGRRGRAREARRYRRELDAISGD